MDINILEEIGLDKNEVKAYLALLELGLTSTGPIVEKSGIPSSRIYQILEQLIDKGLVSHTKIKNIKNFKAQDPKRISELIDSQKKKIFENENQLLKILPFLKEKKSIGELLEKKEQKIQVFEGIKGIKTALEYVLEVLVKGDSFIVFGAPKIGNERLNAFFNDFHKKRSKKGINYKIIYNSDAKEFGEERKKYKLTKVKYLERGMNTPSVFWLFKEYVILVVFSEKPVALLIKNNQMSESFLTYFNYMWKRCRG